VGDVHGWRGSGRPTAGSPVTRWFAGDTDGITGWPLFKPDDTRLIAAYETGAAYRWDIRPESLVRQACRVAGRRLTRAESQRIGIGRFGQRVLTAGCPPIVWAPLLVLFAQ
jgi:hypothetical protein